MASVIPPTYKAFNLYGKIMENTSSGHYIFARESSHFQWNQIVLIQLIFCFVRIGIGESLLSIGFFAKILLNHLRSILDDLPVANLINIVRS